MKWAAIVIATIVLATLIVRFQPFSLHSAGEAGAFESHASVTVSLLQRSTLLIFNHCLVPATWWVTSALTDQLCCWILGNHTWTSLNFKKPWISNQT